MYLVVRIRGQPFVWLHQENIIWMALCGMGGSWDTSHRAEGEGSGLGQAGEDGAGSTVLRATT